MINQIQTSKKGFDYTWVYTKCFCGCGMMIKQPSTTIQYFVNKLHRLKDRGSKKGRRLLKNGR